MTHTNTKWEIDPAHSELIFKVRHMMIANVKGEFRKFSATVTGDDIEKAGVKVVIDAASIYTNDDSRDKHLRSADFFDVENHPNIIFESRNMQKAGDNFRLTGDLIIKGMAKEVVLDVEFGGANKDPWGNEKAGFSLTGKINRKDWGLNWNAALETGGVLVSDEVRIEADVQFIKVTQN